MILVRVHEHDHPVSHTVEDFPCQIGRSLKSHIRIDEPTVSARHAEIRKTDAGHLLVDLGSTNGVTRAGVRVNEVAINGNEVVFIGDVKVELLVEEALAKTKLNYLPRKRLGSSTRHELPRVIAVLFLTYLGLTLVPASEHYREYWPPERPFEILGSALALWTLMLGLAFVISLFCKLNSRRFHFRQVLALMVGSFLASRVIQDFAPTLVFNLHDFAPARFLPHLGYGALTFFFFVNLQRFAFHRWGARLRSLVALGLAVVAILLVEAFSRSRQGHGNRDRMTELGLPLLDPAAIDRSPDELMFDVALKVAESDQSRIKVLEKVEAERP